MKNPLSLSLSFDEFDSISIELSSIETSESLSPMFPRSSGFSSKKIALAESKARWNGITVLKHFQVMIHGSRENWKTVESVKNCDRVRNERERRGVDKWVDDDPAAGQSACVHAHVHTPVKKNGRRGRSVGGP